MKRSLSEKTSSNVNPNRSYTQLFAEVSSSLSSFNREELGTFIRDAREMSKEAKRLMSMECYRVSNQVPDEIWKAIFLSTRQKTSRNNLCFYLIENDFKKLACMSKSWSKIVYEAVRIAFQNREIASNWVLSHFREIEELSLARIIETKIDDTSLMLLTNLKTLYLGRNASKIITYRSVEKLTNLTNLSLVDNISVSTEAFKNLTNLQSLDVSSNTIINSEAIKNPSRLDTLMLDSLSCVNIDRFSNLTTLSIGANVWAESVHEEDFNSNLESIKLLTKLQSLDLNNCCSFEYSDMVKLPNLSSLYIYDNESFPDDVLHLMTNLTYLNISSIGVTSKSIQHLTKLLMLNIEECENIHDDGIKNLESLTRLHINENISDEGIKKLTNLTFLNLYGNEKISDFGIKNLTNLTSLDMYSRSSISSDGIKHLTKLVPKEDFNFY